MARRYGTPEGVLVWPASSGLCVLMTARLTAGHCVWLYSVFKLLPNKRAQSSLRHVACAWVILAHSNCLPTSGYLYQRQRRRQHDSHCGVMCCQVWRKNLRRPACWSRRRHVQWPGLILFGLVWPDPACGLSNYGLSDAWPDLVRSGLTWSNLVWYDPVRGLSDTWPVQLLAD